MITEAQARELIGHDLVTSSGDKIGRIGQIFLDDETGQPEWVTVHTGLFGTNESFVPLKDANFADQGLSVPYDKSRIKDAPNIDVEAGHLSREEEAQLYDYYGLSYSTADSDWSTQGQNEGQYATGNTGTDFSTTNTGVDYAGEQQLRSTSDVEADFGGTTPATGFGSEDETTSSAGLRDVQGNDIQGNNTEGYDTSGPTTDDAMTRSEEQLRVGTETVEAGRARLRKYIVTENVTQTVPVSREEVRVEREPITDSNYGSAMSGPELSEEEHEVVLHAERPVVDKDVQPVERVRLGTETTTDTETVSEEVRREEIDVDGAGTDAGTNRI